MSERICGNCNATLVGPFCAQCGQHAHAGARNLGAVLHDGWHDFTHLDGRLWTTLWYLLARPGKLTVDYFADRRARYLPPVRLYLVLSLAFFGANILHVGDEAAGKQAFRPVTIASPAKAASAPPSNADDPEESAEERKQDQADAIEQRAEQVQLQQDAAKAGADSGLKRNLDVEDCRSISFSPSKLVESRLQKVCVSARKDNGREFVSSLQHNVPRMMFIFLPLLAAILVPLYRRGGRYYVEHLVYLLHNHSALYFVALLLSLVSALVRWLSATKYPTEFLNVATTLYALWYPYRSMRVFYGQGRLKTLFKYSIIGVSYLVFLMLTFVGAIVVTALLV